MHARRRTLAAATAASLALSLIIPLNAGAQSSNGSTGSSDTSGSSAQVTSSAAPTSSAAAPTSAAPTSASQTSTPASTTAKPGTLSPECKAEVEAARKAHEQAVADGTAGSSFMGPFELGKGIINGYGSSGMPDTPQCVIDSDPANKPAEFPDWAKSAEMTPEAEEVFAWINLVLSIGAGFIQLALILAKLNPSFLDALRPPLEAMGINTRK